MNGELKFGSCPLKLMRDFKHPRRRRRGGRDGKGSIRAGPRSRRKPRRASWVVPPSPFLAPIENPGRSLIEGATKQPVRPENSVRFTIEPFVQRPQQNRPAVNGQHFSSGNPAPVGQGRY